MIITVLVAQSLGNRVFSISCRHHLDDIQSCKLSLNHADFRHHTGVLLAGSPPRAWASDDGSDLYITTTIIERNEGCLSILWLRTTANRIENLHHDVSVPLTTMSFACDDVLPALCSRHSRMSFHSPLSLCAPMWPARHHCHYACA